MTPAAKTYDGVAMALHWLIAGLVLIQFFTKFASPDVFAGVNERAMNDWHLAVGPAILLLMLVRIGWRVGHKPPPPSPSVPKLLVWAASGVHWLFYLLLVLVPVSGWLSASGYGAQPTLLGLAKLPPLIAAGRAVGERWGDLHDALTWALLVLIAVHLLAVALHATAKGDGVFQRMLPSGKP